MNWFKLFYMCIKPNKETSTPKRNSTIDNVNVCISNDRLTEGSLNYSESCNSILSELSTIDEE